MYSCTCLLFGTALLIILREFPPVRLLGPSILHYYLDTNEPSTFMKLNLLEITDVGVLLRIHTRSLKNTDVKNYKISENYQKNSTFFCKTENCTVKFQYLTKNNGNFYPEFFRIFRIRFFPGIFSCRDLQGVKLFANFLATFTTYYINYICSLVRWQKVAAMKNAKNILFWGK